MTTQAFIDRVARTKRGPFKAARCRSCTDQGLVRWLIHDNNGQWISGTGCYDREQDAVRLVKRFDLAYAQHIMVQP